MSEVTKEGEKEIPFELLGFDYETTSVEATTTRGVQLAAIALDFDPNKDESSEPIEVINEITDPGVDCHHGALAVHGITPDQIVGKRKDVVVSAELYDYLEERLGNVILCSHNGTTFDAPILWRLAAEHDDGIIRLPLVIPHIDTLILSSRCYPNAPSHKLSQTKEEALEAYKLDNKKDPNAIGLCQWLNLNPDPETGLRVERRAHDAGNDILNVFDLVAHFWEKLAQEGVIENSLWDLALWCATPHILNTCHFGKHRGQPWGQANNGVVKGVPYWYVKFMCNKWTEASPDMVATIWHHYQMRFKFQTGVLIP